MSGNEKDKANESNKEKTVMEAAEAKLCDVDMGKKGERKVETGKKEVFDKELLQVCSQNLYNPLHVSSVMMKHPRCINFPSCDNIYHPIQAFRFFDRNQVGYIRVSEIFCSYCPAKPCSKKVRSFCCLFRLKI